MKVLFSFISIFFTYLSVYSQANTQNEEIDQTKCYQVGNNINVKYSIKILKLGNLLIRNCKNHIDDSKDLYDRGLGLGNKYTFQNMDTFKNILANVFIGKIPMNEPGGIGISLYVNSAGEIIEVTFMFDQSHYRKVITLDLLYSLEDQIKSSLKYTKNESITDLEKDKYIKYNFTFSFKKISEFPIFDYNGAEGGDAINNNNSKCPVKTVKYSDTKNMTVDKEASSIAAKALNTKKVNH